MKIKILVTILLLLAYQTAIADQVVKVVDGDTIHVFNSYGNKIRVRLYGIDTPEKKQPYGIEATQYLKKILPTGTDIKVEIIDIDRYGRAVAIIYLQDKPVSINEQLIADGQAWVYSRYCDFDFCISWQQKEQQAAISKIGLWADDNPIAPWDWRHK